MYISEFSDMSSLKAAAPCMGPVGGRPAPRESEISGALLKQGSPFQDSESQYDTI